MKTMTDHSIQCKTCKAYGGSHSPDCPDITLEDAREQLIQYHKLYNEKYREIDMLGKMHISRIDIRLNKAKKDAEYWQGKFMVVKHENNELRKQINKK